MAKLNRTKVASSGTSSLVASILDGTYDNDLRDIARACYQRRSVIAPETLTGVLSTTLQKQFADLQKAEVAPQPVSDQQDTDDRKDEQPEEPPVDSTQPATTGLLRYFENRAYEHLPPKSVPQVPKGRKVRSDDVFKHRNQKRYYRADFVDHWFSYPYSTPAALNGVTMYVRSINERGEMSVILGSAPNNRRGRFWSMWVSDTPMILGRQAIDHFIIPDNNN